MEIELIQKQSCFIVLNNAFELVEAICVIVYGLVDMHDQGWLIYSQQLIYICQQGRMDNETELDLLVVIYVSYLH